MSNGHIGVPLFKVFVGKGVVSLAGHDLGLFFEETLLCKTFALFLESFVKSGDNTQ